MKNLVDKVIIVVLISIFAIPAVFAQRSDGWNFKRLQSKLNLSDTQKEQIEKLRTDHQKTMIDLRAELEKAQIELRELTSKPDFTRNDFLAAQNKIADFRKEIQLSHANHRMDVLDLMTKDQRKIISDERLFEKAQKRVMQKGKGNRGFNHPMRDGRRQNW